MLSLIRSSLKVLFGGHRNTFETITYCQSGSSVSPRPCGVSNLSMCQHIARKPVSIMVHIGVKSNNQEEVQRKPGVAEVLKNPDSAALHQGYDTESPLSHSRHPFAGTLLCGI